MVVPPGLEPGPPESKSSILTSYTMRQKMAEMTGHDPATCWSTISCSNQLSYISKSGWNDQIRTGVSRIKSALQSLFATFQYLSKIIVSNVAYVLYYTKHSNLSFIFFKRKKILKFEDLKELDFLQVERRKQRPVTVQQTMECVERREMSHSHTWRGTSTEQTYEKIKKFDYL